MIGHAPAAVRCQSLTLPGVPESVAQFRALARLLATTPAQAETAALCTSELVTNALVHTPSGRAGGTITAIIGPGPEPGEMRITVRDDGHESWLPPEAPPATPQTHGYGLALVDALALAWGITTAPPRSTWCEISPEGPAEGSGR